MKKVVVTGGAGFIGSHLVEELVNRDYRVTVIDDLSTGKNVETLTRKDNVEFVRGNITDLPLLQSLFKDVLYVFHQAAIPSVPRSVEHPLPSHEANITGTLNVLLAARDNNVAKVVCASSSSVYGDTPTLPKSEEMPANPQSPYAVTKLAGEYYCIVFKRVYGLSTVSLRYFNVYGPRQDPDSQYSAVIPKFIKGFSEGGSPIIFGDGEQTRDFTYIKDVVEANIQAADSDSSGVFNIAGGKRVTINYLANMIGDIMGKSLKPIYREPRTGDVKHSLADISKAKIFGYEPKYKFLDGLRETIRSFYSEI